MTLPIDQGAQLYYAQDLGMFKRAGLDVTVQTANYGTQVAAAVAGGAIEIGQSNIMSLCVAYERGLPFSLIAAAGLYSSAKPTSMMIVAKDAPYKNAKDLSGKTIAVNGLKSITQVSVLAWADATGGDSTQLKFAEMPFSEMEAALTSGRGRRGTPGRSRRNERARARSLATLCESVRCHRQAVLDRRLVCKERLDCSQRRHGEEICRRHARVGAMGQ